MSDLDIRRWNCPIPIEATAERIVLAHGEGARLSRQLIADVILPRLHASVGGFEDAARVTANTHRLAICTDSHTVSPIFFPGGDLGSLSVYGTVNDLAVAGAKPRWLTFSLIIEEGLPIVVLEQLLDSAARAAAECGVQIVAGDTKVVPRGAVDGVFINTTGVGELINPVAEGPTSIQTGDRIIVSGPVGRHGIAVMCARDEFLFQPPPASDSGSVMQQVEAVRLVAGTGLRAMRDATRGGVSAVLQEWSRECGRTFELIEADVPVTLDVRGACELLGLDPLYVANEGTIVVAVSHAVVDETLTALRRISGCQQAAIIGQVVQKGICSVTIRRTLGQPQPLDEPSGAPLPRIC